MPRQQLVQAGKTSLAGLCWPPVLACAALSLAIVAPFCTAFAGEPATETIVLIRHGEKPASGLGQLSCRGLNRALALPGVLRRVFGRPDAMFAPDPAVRKWDDGEAYDYVRPLATIEPAAIAFGLPVDASFGLMDVAGLSHVLDAPQLRSALVVVAWEHTELVAIARRLLAEHGGRQTDVPDWNRQDFDGIYVVRITRVGAQTSSVFARRNEGLDKLSPTCPRHLTAVSNNPCEPARR